MPTVAQFVHSLLLTGLPWWMPPNGARHGYALDHLMRANLWLLGGCLLLSHLLLLAAIIQRRRGLPVARLPIPRIVAFEAATLLVVGGMFVWMVVSSERLWAHERFEGASPAAMQVEVVGVQFQWYFRYPGENGAFGDTRPELVDAAGGNPLGLELEDERGRDDVVASELVLPVGREVDLRLRAHDVIHGFFVPGMRLKQNAVPGMVLHVHFTPVALGDYPILCSQLCGSGHTRMQARLRVVSQGEYDAWMARAEQRRRTTLARGGE